MGICHRGDVKVHPSLSESGETTVHPPGPNLSLELHQSTLHDEIIRDMVLEVTLLHAWTAFIVQSALYIACQIHPFTHLVFTCSSGATKRFPSKGPHNISMLTPFISACRPEESGMKPPSLCLMDDLLSHSLSYMTFIFYLILI